MTALAQEEDTGMLFELSDLKIGERHRKDMGDIDELVKSIAEQGLLQPIVARSDGTLIAGARRVEAARLLGWHRIPAHVRDDLEEAAALLRAERDENTCRKDFTPSEAVALGESLAVLFREELDRTSHDRRVAAGVASAAKRGLSVAEPGAATKRGNVVPTTSLSKKQAGGTRDRIADAVGMSSASYWKAKQVVTAAESGDPVAQEALAEMDSTGKVEPAYRKLTGKPPSTKPTPFDPTKGSRNPQVAAKNHDRLGVIVNSISGYTDGLDDFNLEAALSVSSGEEVHEWCSMLNASIKRLRQLSADMSKSLQRGKVA